MNEMAYLKRILFLVVLGAAIALLAGTGHAQTTTTDDGCPVMPEGFICFTRVDAMQMAEKVAELDSVKAQNEALKAALAEQKKLTADIQTKLAYEQGRNSALEAQAVRDAAIIQAMIPMLRKKKVGIFNIF